MLAGGAQHSVLPGQHGAYLTAIGGAPGGAGGALGGSHSALTLGPNPMMGLGAAQVSCTSTPVRVHECEWQPACSTHHFQSAQSCEGVFFSFLFSFDTASAVVCLSVRLVVL